MSRAARTKGIVYLVGAGPGDPGLLTLRGRECIAEADVVLHDELVDPRLLRFARRGAEIVHAGKRGDASRRDLQQAEINRRLVAEAGAGRVVVRLKGGDPFVFGRGGEEGEALARAGIPFEIVPGVTSAVAVPAYAGIPVTHRGLNSSFAVVTGHEAPGARGRIDWGALARIDTLVFVMGLRGLGDLLARLVAAGKAPTTPAACIRDGTRPTQRTLVGTVADLAARVGAAGFEPPAVVIVGEVVALRPTLAWFEKRPLLGRTISVTRPREQSAALVERLERLGAEVLEAPAIEIVPEPPAALDAALDRLADFDWVLFTSANGVEIFFDRLVARGTDVRGLGAAHLAAIGPATAAALRKRGLRADVVAESFRAETLAAALAPRVRGRRVLLARAGGARDVLPKALAAAGANVADVATYRATAVRELPAAVRDALAEGRLDAVTFTSASTLRSFAALLGDGAAASLERTRVACIGPVTAAAARSLGIRVDLEAAEYTASGLVDALLEALGRAQ